MEPYSLLNSRLLSSDKTESQGAPPLYGQDFLPHVFTIQGREGIVSKSYGVSDEALRQSQQDAEIMRNEIAIQECLESRMRGTALLPGHVQPVMVERLESEEREKLEDQLKTKLKGTSTYDAKALASRVQFLAELTPSWMMYRYSLMNALWYGRYANVMRLARQEINGDMRTVVSSWQPRHGDKLVFRYHDGSWDTDPDQVGIRISWNNDIDPDRYSNRPRIEATQHGLVYWLDPLQRRTMPIHRHIIEDGSYFLPWKAGSIHGVGIRSRIFWTWWAYQECTKLLLEYLERSALGIEIWRFPAHDPKGEERAKSAAARRSGPGRSAILVPVPAGENQDLWGVQIIEPGLGGVGELKQVLREFFEQKIKRYILGQILTSEAEGTGMGSGVADAHLATLADIVKFDAINLGETLTTDFIRNLQRWNYPSTMGCLLKYVVDTESPESQRKLDAYEKAWSMGAKIRLDDLYKVIGSAKPQKGEESLANPSIYPPQQPAAPAMAGPLGGPEDSGGLEPIEQFSLQSQLKGQRVGDPTDAQKEAGNYQKAHVRLHGIDITIENLAGSVRRGKGWEQKMEHHYGYIKRSEGRDGDHVDVFIGPHPHSELVAVVDQENESGRFDEHKVILGITSENQAKRVYLANYPDGWKCGPITMMTIDQFREWLECGDTTKRVESQVSRYSFDQKRAKKGGEYGANGEWYDGGRFINTIPENRKREGSHNKPASGRVEIEPHRWESPPDEDKRSIFKRLAGIFAKYNHETGKFEIRDDDRFDATLNAYKESRESVQKLIDDYNSGERWYDIKKFGQGFFEWDEDDHPRESEAHDGKKPGEFAPKDKTGAKMSREEALRGATGKSPYEKAVSATFRYQGTSPSDWGAVPIIGFVEVSRDDGSPTSLPKFDTPTGYSAAPVIFKADAGGGCCELCGHAIKIGYPIQNDDKKWTMTVGSECVTHFGEGKSGKKISQEAQEQIDRDTIDQLYDRQRKLFDKGSYSFDRRDSSGMVFGKSRAWARHFDTGKAAEAIYKKINAILNDTSGTNKMSNEMRIGTYIHSHRVVANWLKRNSKAIGEVLLEADQFLSESPK